MIGSLVTWEREMTAADLRLFTGLAMLACAIAVGFLPMSAETYSHIRVWGHAIWGAVFAVGLMLVITSLDTGA